MDIEPYRGEQRRDVIELSIRAWGPVFAKLRAAVPAYVYESFWPDGWEVRQRADVAAILDAAPDTVHVAVEDDEVLGWVAVRLHPEDTMGELHILAVDPAYQRRGIAKALMDHAFVLIRAAGMRMVMVETGDDPGHAASRATYESVGFDRWPVARYFKDLTETAELDGPAGSQMTPRTNPAESRVELIAIDEPVLAELVLAATTDADPDEVTPPLGGQGWTGERVDWLRAFHRDRRAGLIGGDEETSAIRVADRIIGATRLHRVDPQLPDELEYGVWIVRAVRGRGLSSIVFELAVARAIRAGALRISASTTADNEPAVRSLRRAGASLSVRADGSVRAVLALPRDSSVE